MKFLEPMSFRGAMSPVTRACWIFGIGIFEYPVGHPQPVLSFCLSITHLALYLFFTSFARLPVASIMEASTVSLHNYHLSSCFCTNFIVTSMIVAWKAKTIETCNRRISMVNKKLNRFGIAKDYETTFRYQIVQLTVCFVQMIIISVVSISLARDDCLWQLPYIAFWISIHYQLIFIFLIGCSYCGCIRYIGKRFEHLNSRLLQSTFQERATKPSFQYLDNQEPTLFPLTREIHGNLRFAKAAYQRWAMHVLQEARSIHRDLCITAKEMNKGFGIQIFFFVGMSFCNITSLLFSLYHNGMNLTSMHTSPQLVEMIPDCCWLVAYATAVYYLVYCCSMASCEAQRTGVVIHEQVKPDINNDIRAEIDVFSRQLMQDPLQFTAYGFFTLDYTLIRGMVGSVTTYLVIMIQLRGMYNSRADFRGSTTSVTNSTS